MSHLLSVYAIGAQPIMYLQYMDSTLLCVVIVVVVAVLWLLICVIVVAMCCCYVLWVVAMC